MHIFKNASVAPTGGRYFWKLIFSMLLPVVAVAVAASLWPLPWPWPGSDAGPCPARDPRLGGGPAMALAIALAVPLALVLAWAQPRSLRRRATPQPAALYKKKQTPDHPAGQLC